jgi:alcohol dehydrogenase
MRPFDFQLRTRVVFGEGTFARLPDLAREIGGAHLLVVADAGIVAAGLVDRAEAMLREAHIQVSRFHDFAANPDTRMVEAGRAFAAGLGIDGLLAIGGGSSLDCAKGINFLLTNGGTMRDYHGYGKATRPMLPMLAVPTTAGTGSEAQAYALIADADTHTKMACGDPKASFRIAVLDPVLTVSQPREVAAIVGMDALSHAVESFVTSRRTIISDVFAREAWRLLDGNYERVLAAPGDLEARGAMLLGAHSAGIAIEQSMLGATHACANPLTARYGTPHGVAIGVLLPHVVRWNGEVVGERYAELLAASGSGATGLSEMPSNRTAAGSAADRLARRLEQLRVVAGLPGSLPEIGASPEDIPTLSALAAEQWTGTFNPRPFDAAAARALYAAALRKP